MEWVSVKEGLPEIPDGRYGVTVLCAIFDEFDYHNGQGGQHFEVGLYMIHDERLPEGPCPELDPSIDYKKRFEFSGYLDDGFEGEENIPWHEVTHWMIPELPYPPGEKE